MWVLQTPLYNISQIHSPQYTIGGYVLVSVSSQGCSTPPCPLRLAERSFRIKNCWSPERKLIRGEKVDASRIPLTCNIHYISWSIYHTTWHTRLDQIFALWHWWRGQDEKVGRFRESLLTDLGYLLILRTSRDKVSPHHPPRRDLFGIQWRNIMQHSNAPPKNNLFNSRKGFLHRCWL